MKSSQRVLAKERALMQIATAKPGSRLHKQVMRCCGDVYRFEKLLKKLVAEQCSLIRKQH